MKVFFKIIKQIVSTNNKNEDRQLSTEKDPERGVSGARLNNNLRPTAPIP